MLGKILIVLFVRYTGPTLVDPTWHVTRVRKLQTSIAQPPMQKNQVRKLELSPLLLAHMYFQDLCTYIT